MVLDTLSGKTTVKAAFTLVTFHYGKGISKMKDFLPKQFAKGANFFSFRVDLF